MNSIKILSGFTILELLVSLTILCILLLLVAPSFQRTMTRRAIKPQAWEILRAGIYLMPRHHQQVARVPYDLSEASIILVIAMVSINSMENRAVSLGLQRWR